MIPTNSLKLPTIPSPGRKPLREQKKNNKETLLNIACDREAEQVKEHLAGQTKCKPILPKEVQVVLDIKGKYCFRNMREAIYEAASGGEMLECFEDKYHWGNTIQLID